MRILVVSRPCILDVNRRLYVELAGNARRGHVALP